jgi:hypothetical protein
MERCAFWEIRGVFKAVWHEMRCIPDVYINGEYIEDLAYARDVVEYVFNTMW